jgi:hypothetical protein
VNVEQIREQVLLAYRATAEWAVFYPQNVQVGRPEVWDAVRLAFPLSDHSIGWIDFQSGQDAHDARRELLGRLAGLAAGERQGAYDIIGQFHAGASDGRPG